jgi:hypothetical protein
MTEDVCSFCKRELAVFEARFSVVHNREKEAIDYGRIILTFCPTCFMNLKFSENDHVNPPRTG